MDIKLKIKEVAIIAFISRLKDKEFFNMELSIYYEIGRGFIYNIDYEGEQFREQGNAKFLCKYEYDDFVVFKSNWKLKENDLKNEIINCLKLNGFEVI